MPGNRGAVYTIGRFQPEHLAPLWARYLSDRPSVAVPVDRFPDGELRVRLPVAPTTRCDIWCDFGFSAQRRFDMAQLLDVCAVGRAALQLGAESVRLVTPEVPCMRQDRPVAEHLELGARPLVLDMLRAAGFRQIVASYMKFDVPSTAALCVARPGPATIARWFAGHCDAAYDLVVGPDAGSGGLARLIAATLGVPVLIMAKNRLSPTEVDESVGPAGLTALRHARRVLITDDLLVSGGTLCMAASVLRAAAERARVDAFIWMHRPTAQGVSRLSAALHTKLLHSVSIPDISVQAPYATALSAEDIFTPLFTS